MPKDSDNLAKPQIQRTWETALAFKLPVNELTGLLQVLKAIESAYHGRSRHSYIAAGTGTDGVL